MRSATTGNGRLTAMLGVVLLAVLAAEGVTILFMGPLLAEHIFIGAFLIPVVAAKLASTGYRFARYYAKQPDYRLKGPPPTLLRLIAPFTVLLTLTVLATGVALVIRGPGGGLLLLAHKASFIAWLAFMGLHVLGHLRELPAEAAADWRRSLPAARVAGASARLFVVGSSIVLGVVVAAGVLSLAGPWLHAHLVG